MDADPPLGLFEGYGVELEYMIVRRATLDVLPASDEVLRALCGAYEAEVEAGPLAWSNELALHVLEFKTNGPADALDGLAATFQDHVARANELLEPLEGALLPTAMHPWMDPARETRLWPHEYNPVYQAYDRIFGARGHGWANVQSTHLNLPFAGDDEFRRLHAAVRLLLPLLPGLAASSPVVDGRVTGFLDTRLEYYRKNQARIPSILGAVVPETVKSRREYEERILQPSFRDIAPLDPEGVLRHEWLNSRGCIARFERDAVEIRILDVQECPEADLAVLALVSRTAEALVNGRGTGLAGQEALATKPLARLFLDAVERGENAEVRDTDHLRALGLDFEPPVRVGDVWTQLAEELLPGSHPLWETLGVLLEEGTLATRILRRLGPEPDRRRIEALYRELMACLAGGTLLS